MRGGVADIRFYEYQAPITLNQANPISGTQYALLPTTTYVMLLVTSGVVTWTVQPSPLEMHMNLDGQTPSPARTNPVSTTVYHLKHFSMHTNGLSIFLDATNLDSPLNMAAKSMGINLETTGGTVQNLSGQISYMRFI